MRSLLLAFLVVLLASCSSTPASDAPLTVADGCQPLFAGEACFLPFPSDFYTAADPTSPTGRRVIMSGAGKLTSVDGKDADLVSGVHADGFSLHATIVATLFSELVVDGLPNLMDDPAASATPASATLLLEADTGRLVAHYVDLDTRASDPAQRAISIRAFAPLLEKTRYIVALVKVQTPDGSLAPPPEGFRRLRDERAAADPSLTALASHYDAAIFPPLEAAGVHRAELQLAWDFTTGTRDAPLRDMLAIRAKTLTEIAQNPPTVKITASAPGTGSVWKTIHGTITAPMFLDSAEPGAHLLRDASGVPVMNGTVVVPFYATIPTAVRDAFGPGRALTYGHGFFGDTTELDGIGGTTIGTKLSAVEFGIDWWGMSKPDEGLVVNTLASTPALTLLFTERVHQAMANWLALTAAIRGPLTKLPELSRSAAGPDVHTENGQSNASALLYDSSSVYYFGASQGGILGTVMVALNPDILRGVINVGGGPFSHLMSRAGPFAPFFLVANGTMGNTLRAQALMGMFQAKVDTIDPAVYAAHILTDGFDPSAKDKRVLFQAGLGDQGVPNLGTFYLARELGLRMTTPAAAVEFGIPDAPAEGLTSALTLWDFGVDLTQYRKPGTIAANPVHDSVRLQPTALAQMDAFYKSGAASRIIHPCPGPCKGQ